MIKKIEKLLNVTLSENSVEEVSEPVENIKETNLSKNTNKQWEDAFSNILKNKTKRFRNPLKTTF